MDRTRESKGIPTAHTVIDTTKFLSQCHARVAAILRRINRAGVMRGQEGEERKRRSAARESKAVGA